jgi:hypothetical protein
MHLDRPSFERVLAHFRALRLVSARESEEVLSVFDTRFPFARAVPASESVHVHVKVDDTAALPRTGILAAGTQAENEKEGYVKFRFTGGINMIFSSIDVAIEDALRVPPPLPKPFVDHIGIDLREEAPAVRAIFDEVPSIAARLGWRHAGQGGHGKPVFCCHTSVEEKHWVYPPAAGAIVTRPLEFAYGAL